jgi:capsular exopolysaccharide synthesis family protein
MIYPRNPDQNPPSYPAQPQPAGTYGESSDELSLRDLWHTLARYRWLVVGTTVAVIAAAGAFTWMQDPVFESATTIRIDDEKGRLNPLAEMIPGGGMARGIIETEMVVLQSRQIAASVVDSLALHVRLLEPRLPRDQVLQVRRASPQAVPGTFQLRANSDGTYSTRLESGLGGVRLPERVEPGRPFQVGDVTLVLHPSVAPEAPARLTIEIAPYGRVVGDLRAAMRVTRPNRDAQVVSVSYRDTDPRMAAAVPNAAAHSFIFHKTYVAKAETRSTVAFLREQVASYEGQLEGAETRLRGFREQAQVVNLAAEASEQVRRLAELQARRDELQAERDALARLLVQASQPAARDAGRSPYRQLASYPVFLANKAIQDLLQSLTHLENQRAELIVRRTAENIDIRGIDGRIAELEGQLFQTAQSYLASLDSQLGSLNANLSRFGSELERIPAREVQFARLSRQSQLLEQIYTLLQTRLKEAEIREAVEATEVRVIDPALVAERPVAPRPMLNLALAAVLGLMLGVGSAFGRQALDTKVRSREDAEAATGGLAVLGMIPRIQPDSARNGAAEGGAATRIRVGRLVGQTPMYAERLVTRRNPRSPTAEAYRALRTSITFANAERAPQVIVVTSAMMGDGKSTSAANLAITLAQQGTRTLLVDADLRRGVLHRVFDAPQQPGFTHVLLGHSPLTEAVQEIELGDGASPLHFLPTGVLPPNPAELLGSERTRVLLAELRERYDAVVFDAPPLNLVTDAALLGTIADTTILVTRTGVTDKGALRHAVGHLNHLRVHVGGVVLNDIDAAGGRYYGGYGYYGGTGYYGHEVEPVGTRV